MLQKSLWTNGRRLILDFLGMLFSPTFWMVTIIGNVTVIVFSLVFYSIEYGHNPNVSNHLDSLWWAFATVTTVGYGDIIPVTDAGKILGMALMLVGTGIFATYTAFFADIILMRQVRRFGLWEKRHQRREDLSLDLLHALKHDIKNLEEEIKRLQDLED